MNYHRHLLHLQALTPIAHGDTAASVPHGTNVRLFMRQALLLDGEETGKALGPCQHGHIVRDSHAPLRGGDDLGRAGANVLVVGSHGNLPLWQPTRAFALIAQGKDRVKPGPDQPGDP